GADGPELLLGDLEDLPEDLVARFGVGFGQELVVEVVLLGGGLDRRLDHLVVLGATQRVVRRPLAGPVGAAGGAGGHVPHHRGGLVDVAAVAGPHGQVVLVLVDAGLPVLAGLAVDVEGDAHGGPHVLDHVHAVDPGGPEQGVVG